MRPSSNKLVWDGFKLKLGRRVVATVQPDAKWPRNRNRRFAHARADHGHGTDHLARRSGEQRDECLRFSRAIVGADG
jgi:hypothetical protein